MTSGIVHLRYRADGPSTAVRVDLADSLSPASARGLAGPEVAATPVPASVSVSDIARDIKARSTTSTTKPRAKPTTTTIKGAAAAPTSSTVTTATTTAPKPATPAPPPPPATTTTTAAPTLIETVVPPATAVTSALTRSDSGVASWFKTAAGTCAHRTLEFGTVVKVTRLLNGATATCKVNDRGPTVATGRLIDLSLDTFEKLADRDAGLIDVKIEW